jgi:tetratricopeptide (TPR) repeat protein
MHQARRINHRDDQADVEPRRTFWNRVDEFRLRSRWASAIFLTALTVPCVILLFETGRVVIAQTLSDSFKPNLIRQAIALDPANPDPHFGLAKILLLTGDPSQQVTAEKEFRAAIERNPNFADYWSGLGTACYANGDQSCADASFTRARQLAPSNPDFAWQAAINDVVSHQPQAAIGELNTFLRLQPDGLTQSFQLLTRGFEDPELVWRELLGSADLSARMKFLEFLAASERVEAANGLWKDLVSQKKSIALTQVAPLVDQLLWTEHYADAANVWSYARNSSSSMGSVLSEPNLIFNGSFEQQPLNAGFDWRYTQQSYVDLNFSDPTAKDGRRALKVDFTVPQNSEYELIYQFVPVLPNHSYDLSALLKTQGVTSDSGPKLRVFDPHCLACLDASTQGVTGTSDWRRVSTRFTTGPTTEVVRISLWRPRSRTYPTEISGQLWLDNVSLLPSSRTEAQQ